MTITATETRLADGGASTDSWVVPTPTPVIETKSLRDVTIDAIVTQHGLSRHRAEAGFDFYEMVVGRARKNRGDGIIGYSDMDTDGYTVFAMVEPHHQTSASGSASALCKEALLDPLRGEKDFVHYDDRHGICHAGLKIER